MIFLLESAFANYLYLLHETSKIFLLRSNFPLYIRKWVISFLQKFRPATRANFLAPAEGKKSRSRSSRSSRKTLCFSELYLFSYNIPLEIKHLPLSYTIRRYSPLCRLTSSFCGGLWPGKSRAFYAVFANSSPSLVFGSPLSNFQQ